MSLASEFGGGAGRRGAQVYDCEASGRIEVPAEQTCTFPTEGVVKLNHLVPKSPGSEIRQPTDPSRVREQPMQDRIRSFQVVTPSARASSKAITRRYSPVATKSRGLS